MMPATRLRRITLICFAALGAALILLSTTAVVFAETQKMTAAEAYSAALNEDLIILDIRSPGEWAETGVAKGAWPVTLHDPSFSANLQRIIGRYPDKRLALICATGGRSKYVADVLEENGVLGVIDISEGMFGNGKFPGWIARNLPIVDVEAARTAYTKSILRTE